METSFNGTLHFVHINSFRIVKPSKKAAIEVRQKAEAHLRSKYQPGLYTNSNECNEIFKFMFSFYESYLDSLLPKISTCWWVAGIIFQYEQTGKISAAYKKGDLSDADTIYWREKGALLRQALDYLCEKMGTLGEIDNLETTQKSQVLDFEKALICAKGCVEYSNVSNYTFMVVPNATSVKIFPVGERYYLEHSINPTIDPILADHLIQNNNEVSVRDKYLDRAVNPFDFQYHIKLLDEPFKEKFGITYKQFQGLVASLVVYSKKIEDPRQVPMQLKELFFSNAAHNNRIPVENVESILSQLILDKSIPRELWNSRQYNRINKKPFLEFQSKGRTVLMWSHNKISDYLALLDSDLTFNKIPPGWNSKPLVDAVSKISNFAGKWFEKSAIVQLEKLGFKGREIKNDTFVKFSNVNFDCGQIDYLGYYPKGNCLAIFEFKMIETGFDARGIRQVSTGFLNGNDSYVKVFTKKINWLKSNLNFIKEYYKKEYNIVIPQDLNQVRSIFITFYPTLLNLFYTDISCKSLVQFVDNCDSNGIWPYKD